MQDIIFSLLQRISSLPEIAYASADWGQLSYNAPPVEWPCALIDISQVSLHDHLQEQQSAEGIITVTLADYIDASVQALDPPEDYALEMRIYSAIDALHQALQGYNTPGFSPPLPSLHPPRQRLTRPAGLCHRVPLQLDGDHRPAVNAARPPVL